MKNIKNLIPVNYKGRSIKVVQGILGNGNTIVAAKLIHQGKVKDFTGKTKVEAVGYAKSFIDKIL